MDRRYRWKLLEYRQTERSHSFDTHIWVDEPKISLKVRKETGLEELLTQCKSEWNQILTMMDWVHNLSAHQGWDEAPRLGALELLSDVRGGKVTFRCVEFAHMLQHVCSAFGVPSRVVGLRRANSETGLGKGHVVVDVWSNEHQKWVVLDPQMNMYYLDQSGNPLSLFELHDRVRQENFEDIIMSREAEMESEFTSFSAKDNSDYNAIEVLDGFDRDETWESLADRSDFRSFTRFWEEYYFHFAVRRIHSFNRDKSITGSSGGNVLYYYDPQELPPIVFQRMRQTFAYTCDRTKIDFPINGVEIQWIPCEATEEMPIEETRKITLFLKHSTPWFDHYEILINKLQLNVNQQNLEVCLQVGENYISVTPVNTLGRKGIKSVVRMIVN